jgi:hypothetical protein
MCRSLLPWEHWRVIAEHAACEAPQGGIAGDDTAHARLDPVRVRAKVVRVLNFLDSIAGTISGSQQQGQQRRHRRRRRQR